MKVWVVAALLTAIAATIAPMGTAWSASAQSPPTHDFGAMIAGITTGGQVIVAGTPLSSGAWGTDYITVSHALGVGRQYSIILSGPPAPARPIMACSSQAHGIDVLILRVAAHTNRSVLEWGETAELRAGDELLVYVRKEFNPEHVKFRFVHHNLVQWSRTTPDQWSHQWHNVMVADGQTKPGYSGSPWVRNGKVVGLHKGSAQLPGEQIRYALAETATRARQCLKDQHYDELVPKE